MTKLTWKIMGVISALCVLAYLVLSGQVRIEITADTWQCLGTISVWLVAASAAVFANITIGEKIPDFFTTAFFTLMLGSAFAISAEIPVRYFGVSPAWRFIHIFSILAVGVIAINLTHNLIVLFRRIHHNWISPRGPLGPRVKSVFIRLLPWAVRGPHCWLASAINR
ncbi:MAG: hypothetical protein V1853_05370 [bacterium]